MVQCAAEGLLRRPEVSLAIEIAQAQQEATRIRDEIAAFESLNGSLTDSQRQLVIDAAEAHWSRTNGTQKSFVPGLCNWARQRP